MYTLTAITYKMKKHFRITIIFLFLFITALTNQVVGSPILNHITDLNGLPSNTVYKIYKDSHGMMWFGTFNGICRFNGVTFTYFYIDSPKLENAVTDIVELENNQILFGTSKGLYLVDPNKQSCIKVCTQVGYVNCIKKTKSTIFVGSTNGLWIYKNPQEAEAISFENSVISKNNIVNDITDDGKDGIWLCSNEFLIHIDIKTKNLEKYRIGKELLTGNLKCICRIQNNIYIGTRNSGLLVFDLKTKSTKKYIDLDCPVICDLNSDGNKLLYVATDGNGAYILNTETNNIIKSYRTNTTDLSLPSNAVYTFWYDKELNISWFGFASDGMCYNYNHNPLFHIYKYKDFDTKNLQIRSLRIHNKDKAIGTRDGLYFISEDREIIKHFTPKEIGGRTVTNIQYFGNHFVIATYEKGLSILDPTTLRLKHLNNNELIENANFSRIEPLANKWLFACSNMGIFILDTNFNIVKHFTSRNSELPNTYICDIVFDLTGKGWIGTMYQLAIYDSLTQTIQSRDFPKNYFNNEANLTFNLCRNGDILAVSESSVFRSKSDLSEYKTLNLYQKLNIGNIFFITENRQGSYWMGTDKGLFLLDKNLNNYCQFNENDNLPSLKFNRNEFQETSDGTFWMANTKGLVYLTSKDLKKIHKKINGKIVLNKIYIENIQASPTVVQRQLEFQKLHLTWNFKSQKLEIQPLLLNYGKPEGRYYEWKLDEKEYQSCIDGEILTFNNLPLGSHKLKIRLAGHPETETIYTISIYPSLVFYMEVFFLILVIITLWRIKVIRKKRLKLKNLLLKKHLLDTEIASANAVQALIKQEEKKKQEEHEAKLQAMYEKSRMNQNEYKALYKKVKECMEQEKAYTNPNLRITDLATMVDCTPTKLSQMFNQYLHQNFFDFINQYRVEEFKHRVTNEKYSQYTAVAISETCGFKRSSFFAAFKKIEHCTPSEYLQKHGINRK